MSIWYRTTNYSHDIEPVEVERETKARLFLAGGRRTLKENGWELYFSDRSVAARHLIDRQAQRIRRAEEELRRERERLEKLCADFSMRP